MCGAEGGEGFCEADEAEVGPVMGVVSLWVGVGK